MNFKNIFFAILYSLFNFISFCHSNELKVLKRNQKLISVFFLFVLILNGLNSQNCAVQGNGVHYSSPPPNFHPDELVTIKTMIYTLEDTDGTRHISDDAIFNNIDIVNAFYSTFNIQFEIICIKSGYNADLEASPHSYLGVTDANWFTPNVLSILIARPVSVPPGVEPPPAQAAILGKHRAFLTGPNNSSHVFAFSHEIGHMLNLKHTFGDNVVDDVITDECAGSHFHPSTGDGIADTPPDPLHTYIDNLGVVRSHPEVGSGCSIDANDLMYDENGDPLQTDCGQEFEDALKILTHNPMSYYACDETQYFTQGQLFQMRCWIYNNYSSAFNIANGSGNAIDAIDFANHFVINGQGVAEMTNKDLIIDGMVYINYHLILNNCNLFFTPGSGLDVGTGGSLIVNNSSLEKDAYYTCGNISQHNQWAGIKFSGDILSIKNNSRLVDAKLSINSGSISMENSEFVNFNVSIDDAGANGPWLDFQGTPNILTQGCNFIKSTLSSFAGPHLIYNCRFHSEGPNQPEGLKGMNLNVINNKINTQSRFGSNTLVERNEINNNLVIYNIDNFILRNNKINAYVTGWGLEGFIIRNNDFNENQVPNLNLNDGSDVPCVISSNNFYGTIGVQHYNAAINLPELQFRCNNFENEEIAIHAKGLIADKQGTSDIPAFNIWNNTPEKLKSENPITIKYYYTNVGNIDDPMPGSTGIIKERIQQGAIYQECSIGTDWEELEDEPLLFGWFWGCGILYYADMDCILQGSSDCCNKVAMPTISLGSSPEDWSAWALTNVIEDCYKLPNVGGESRLVIGEVQNELDTKTDQKLQIYPNPNSGIFTIQNSDYEKYEIVDISNKLIVSGSLESINYLNLDNIYQGVYFVKFFKGEQWFETRKIIILE